MNLIQATIQVSGQVSGRTGVYIYMDGWTHGFAIKIISSPFKVSVLAHKTFWKKVIAGNLKFMSAATMTKVLPGLLFLQPRSKIFSALNLSGFLIRIVQPRTTSSYGMETHPYGCSHISLVQAEVKAATHTTQTHTNPFLAPSSRDMYLVTLLCESPGTVSKPLNNILQYIVPKPEH